ncbi:hypothetical protein K466DRAFT_660832 [Polyporus arcularius HHB13444]|uniref:Fungal-type protein kinase domain-containing protein n=1 Tax=Polyporus arcularius HHB13444 TaxID=1314778 RepID=A0A5C3PNB1_9APHY|nr:hypothetical protein K466DRAFT_660832 [Polyporus arcularius HHB13444]
MLTDQQLKALTEKLQEMHEEKGYEARAENANPTQIINEYIFDVVQGKSTQTVYKSGKAAQFSKVIKRTTASGSSPSASSSPYCFGLVKVVPHYVMRLSPHKYYQSDDEVIKADAAMFRNDVVEHLKEGRPNWAYQRLFGEFRLSGSQYDPFEDAELSDTQPSAGSREEVRGHLIANAERVFVYQHRTAVYSFFVIGQEFRFFRWDRAGLFVTQKVDYVKNTRTLVEFFLGFAVLDDASQGIDTTVTLLEKRSQLYMFMDSLAKGDPKALGMRVLSYGEGDVLPEDIPVETFELPLSSSPEHDHDSSETSGGQSQQAAASGSTITAIPATTNIVRRPKEGSFVFQYVLDYFASSLEDNWPRYQVPIGSDTFLVARPIFKTTGLTGRGTRGYVAWHVQSKSFVFLKDAWRPIYNGVEMEGDILQGLNDAGVEHIPTLLRHGQVASQETRVSHYAQYVDTRTNDERKAESRSRDGETSKGKKRTREGEYHHHIRHYTHHRLATKEVCLPLVAFTSSKQLVSLVNDCVAGHADAYKKRRIIHRDITSGNMLILPMFETTDGGVELRVVWKGLLCDWELSKPQAPSNKGEQPERTGTWQYMSVASSGDALHIIDIADELESFFNVILYNAVRYVPHTFEQFTTSFLKEYFDVYKILPNGEFTVGTMKVLAITILGYIPIGNLGANTMLTFGESPLKQNKALNTLIFALLKRFKARYAVLDYEAKVEPCTAGDESAVAAETSDRQLSPRPTQRPRIEREECGDEEELIVPFGPARPSDATYNDAARLKDHDDVKRLLCRALDQWTWPEFELKSDHLTQAAVVDSPRARDGMSVDITPSASLPGAKAVLTYPMAPVPDPHIKRRPAQTTGRSTTGSGSVQLAWDRSGTT